MDTFHSQLDFDATNFVSSPLGARKRSAKDPNCTRFVSFLMEAEDLISCEICMENFHPTTRPPKLLPCGHNFCKQCLFSLCCHQQYYLLDSINCPSCRVEHSTTIAQAAPTNFDLCKMLESVQRSFDVTNNITVIQVPDVTSSPAPKRAPEMKIEPKCRNLAEKTKGAKHVRCKDCSRKMLLKDLGKVSRYCVQCNKGSARVLYTCLECCVNAHNGHSLYTFMKLEQKLMKTLAELRILRGRFLDSSQSFDLRMDEIGHRNATQISALHTQKQNILSLALSSLDSDIHRLEKASVLPMGVLNGIQSEHLHNLSKLSKMSSELEKNVFMEPSPIKPAEHRMKRCGSSMRRSRLTLHSRSDDSLARECLQTIISIMPRDQESRQLHTILTSFSNKDTVEIRKMAYLNITNVIMQILYRGIEPGELPIFADGLLNSFYQLNVLSKKRESKGKTSRVQIWKAVQQTYSLVIDIAAKSYPTNHPDRIDIIDDLAYISHLFSDVCDQATIALLFIEAARARAAQENSSKEDEMKVKQKLQLIDSHLVELRRLQRLQNLRSKTTTKREAGLRRIWSKLFRTQKN